MNKKSVNKLVGKKLPFPTLQICQQFDQSRYFSYHLDLKACQESKIILQTSNFQQHHSQLQKSQYTLTISFNNHISISNELNQFIYGDQFSLGQSDISQINSKLLIQPNTQKIIPQHLTCNLTEIINHPYFLFYCLFATKITIPLDKMYKKLVKQFLQQHGLSFHWCKTSNFYKIILNQNNTEKPIIFVKDLLDLHNLDYHGQYLQINNTQLVEKIKKIKKRNAYQYCKIFFQEKFIPKLMTIQQDKISAQYQKLLKIMQKLYNTLCCKARLQLLNNSALQQIITNLNNGYCYQSCISKHKKHEQYTLKQLKQQIQQILTVQKIQKSQQNLTTTIDQQYKQLIHETIQQIFTYEYQQIKEKQQNKNKLTIYRQVINKISQQMDINYKSRILIDILLNHILNTRNRNRIDISKLSQVNNRNRNRIDVSKLSQVNFCNFLSFQQGETEELLLSQTSRNSENSKNNGKINKQNEQKKHKLLAIQELNQYIKYLQQDLNKNGIKFKQLQQFKKQQTNKIYYDQKNQNSSLLLDQSLQSFNLQLVNPSKHTQINNAKYLGNKIQQIKRQNLSDYNNNTIKNKLLSPTNFNHNFKNVFMRKQEILNKNNIKNCPSKGQEKTKTDIDQQFINQKNQNKLLVVNNKPQIPLGNVNKSLIKRISSNSSKKQLWRR